MSDIAKEAEEKGLNAPKVTIEHIESLIIDESYMVEGYYTVCILTLKNGFKIDGATGAVSQDNFDKDLGRKYARKRAVEKIWALEGYLLAQRLYEKNLVRLNTEGYKVLLTVHLETEKGTSMSLQSDTASIAALTQMVTECKLAINEIDNPEDEDEVM